jgi:hypothetical protein
MEEWMAFEVSSYGELLALQRVFLEAKFAEEPEVDELIMSPFVADMWLRVIRELQKFQSENGKPEAQLGWEQWLRDKIRVGCREWNIAINRTKRHFKAQPWSSEEKKKYAALVFSPFILSEESILEFLNQVEAD